MQLALWILHQISDRGRQLVMAPDAPHWFPAGDPAGSSVWRRRAQLQSSSLPFPLNLASIDQAADRFLADQTSPFQLRLGFAADVPGATNPLFLDGEDVMGKFSLMAEFLAVLGELVTASGLSWLAARPDGDGFVFTLASASTADTYEADAHILLFSYGVDWLARARGFRVSSATCQQADEPWRPLWSGPPTLP